MRVIRRRDSLALMNAIHLNQPARFRDLATLPQASTSTLAETLGALEAAHLVAHHTAEATPTSTHSLTASGEKPLSRLRRLLDDVSSSSASSNQSPIAPCEPAPDSPGIGR